MSEASMAAGRPRGFNQQAALDGALELFSLRGYEGASVADLTEAMGISRPSLYAAFGDKEQLFRAVLTRYVAGPGSYVQRALELPQTAEAMRALLLGAAAAFTSPDHPPGCLVVHSALASGDEGATARDLLLGQRLTWQTTIRARLERGVADDDMPGGTAPVIIAEYVMTILNGMAVQALAGADHAVLTAVASIALRALGLGEPAAALPKKNGRAPAASPSKLAKSEGLPGQLMMDL